MRSEVKPKKKAAAKRTGGGAPTADGPGAPADDPVDAAPQALPRATAAPHRGEALQEPALWPRADNYPRGAPPPSAPRDDDGRPGTRSAFETRGLRHDDHRGAATHASCDRPAHFAGVKRSSALHVA